MNISFTKKCVWQVKHGSILSFNKDSSYKVKDSIALEIINAGYAFQTVEKEYVPHVDKEKKSIKDYVKKVISSDENKSKDDNKIKKSKKKK